MNGNHGSRERRGLIVSQSVPLPFGTKLSWLAGEKPRLA